MQIFSSLGPIHKTLEKSPVSWDIAGDTLKARVSNFATKLLPNVGKSLYNVVASLANAGIFLWNKTVTWLNPPVEGGVLATVAPEQEAGFEDDTAQNVLNLLHMAEDEAASELYDDPADPVREIVESLVSNAKGQIMSLTPWQKTVAVAGGFLGIAGIGAYMVYAARNGGAYHYPNSFSAHNHS